MLAPTISKVREFLSSWKNLLALGTLPLLGAWIYSRVWMVNPAILGDEYLYSMNARKVGPWDPPVAGDFSNYLFNFVYQGTNLCGDAFYACGKIFNIVFFLGFIFTVFVLALRFLPFWGAFAFMIASALSPLSVYTSMFLPESMYFFFIGLVLTAVLRAMRSYCWQNWVLVGLSLGAASLVKPHAWLSAIAITLTLVIVGLSNKDIGFKLTVLSLGSLGIASIAARIALGLLVAGPKALGFFGQYLGFDTLETLSNPLEPVAAGSPDPLAGVSSLFASQLGIHFLTISALMAFGLAAAILGMTELFKTRVMTDFSALALLSVVWLGSLVIEIVIFTGWVTGLGDDHSSRVLLRYYEFLFIVVPLAGVVSLSNKSSGEIHFLVRWAVAVVFGTSMTIAFSGFFASLTIQIADAPTLAGLVVNNDIFSLTSILGLLSLVVLAIQPRFGKWMFVLLLPVTMIGTGFQTQDQYQIARAEESVSDKAGKFVFENYSAIDASRSLILSTSRFDATSTAFQIDSPTVKYELLPEGSVYVLDDAPAGISMVVVSNSLDVVGNYRERIALDGFEIFLLED